MTPVEMNDRSEKVVGLPTHTVSAMKLTTGSGLIVTVLVMVSVQFPPDEAMSVTRYVPYPKYVCTGFCKVLVLPSPKFQNHRTELMDVFKNDVGELRQTGFTVNPATGGGLTMAF